MASSASIGRAAHQPLGLEAIIERLDAAQSERRRASRAPFDYRLLLTPLDGLEPILDPIYVTGRDLSARGVGFEHDEPLTYRKVRLSAADEALTAIGLDDLEIDLELRWCRFVRAGVYESGGQITRSTTPVFLL